MATTRSVNEKVSDTLRAFETLRHELTPDAMRALIKRMSEQQPDDTLDVAGYASLVNASMQLARVVAANDRAAMMAAAMITQSGVSRPILNSEEE